MVQIIHVIDILGIEAFLYFISHMVQIILIRLAPPSLKSVIFISHMVQIIPLNCISITPLGTNFFISHMVQIILRGYSAYIK